MNTVELKEVKRTVKMRMMDTMLNVVKHYQADIVMDFEFVDEMKATDKALWLLRTSGTDIGKYSDIEDPNKWITLSIPRAEYAFVIEDFELKQIDIAELKAGVK